MKDRYRFLLCIVVLGIIYLVVISLNKSDIDRTFAGLLQKGVVKTVIPSYAYMENIENNYDFSLTAAILNDIYPMNEYLLANDGADVNINTSSMQNDYFINEDNSVSVQRSDGNNNSSNGSDISTESQYTTDDKNNKNNSPEYIAGNKDNIDAEDNNLKNNNSDNIYNKEVSGEVRSAISRNVITGSVFPKENLVDYNFIHNNFYTVTSITSLTSQILRPAEFLEKDMSVSHNADTPQILIFHTHSQETFSDSVEGDISTSIVGVGDYLTTLLTQKYGYNVIHDTSVYDYVNGKLDRSKAYTYAENGIAAILEQNPSIDVVIDLHRDGVAEGTRLVTNVDGKDMAKVMLFNGLSYSNLNGDIGYLYNPYRDDNLATSLQLYLLGQAYYPDYLRRIYVNAYRYCLHERGKSMLIEAGAQTNTYGEVKNAMEPLADLLDKLLRGERAY